jgi:Beta-L-arabinofuranosidase, GH127
MQSWQRAVLAVVLAGIMVAGGMRAFAPKPEVDKDTTPTKEVTVTGEVDLAPYFAIARSVVAHAKTPDTTQPPRRRGVRAFVTAWRERDAPVRATALGVSLRDSIIGASELVAAKIPEDEDVRIEIDLLTHEEDATLGPEMSDRQVDVGLHGYLAEVADGKVGFVLPAEVIHDKLASTTAEHGVVQLKGDRITGTILARAGADGGAIDTKTARRFTVSEAVEGAKVGEAPISLFRGMPPHPKDPSADALLAGVRAGADYLARGIDDHGVFTYLYDPSRDRVEKGYEMLRHAGAIYALMEAYEELHVPEWKKRADLAVAYLKTKIVSTPDGSYFVADEDEEQQKAGASGLGLVALAEYEKVTGDKAELPLMRELARYIVHQQYPDGHFRENADVQREEDAGADKDLKKEVSYYAGEATLGLVRLYALDPKDQWLTASKKGADYLVDVRDADKNLKHQIPDHWLSYALRDLYVITHKDAYAAHAHKIAEAIMAAARTPASVAHLDYVGSFFDAGDTTPTSTRLEALTSTMQLARFIGSDESKMRETATDLAGFTLGQQIDPENGYFAENLSRAIGGVRRGLLRTDVRIDFVQHAVSSWLRLARLVRDPTWGKTP